MEFLKINEYARFEIEKVVDSIGYITIRVREITAWDENNEPIEFETYLGVPIKFDGGFHFNFGDSDGYLYLSTEDIDAHCVLMKRIHQIAKEHFNNEYI